MKKILNILVVSIFLSSTVIPATVFAVDINTNYAPLTDIPGFAEATSAKNPGGMLNTLFNLSIGIGGILAVIMIIFAGFKYMYEESISGKSDAKAKITNAFFGLLLILGSYIILRTINSDLLRINLLLPQGDTTALRNLISKQKTFETEMDNATRAANIALNEASKIRNNISTLDTEIALLKNKIGTATSGFENERKLLASAEQKRGDLVNQELYIRAKANPSLAITRAQLELLGNREASGSTMSTDVKNSLTNARRANDVALQSLNASDPQKTNPITQKQIAEIGAQKILLDRSTEQLLLIDEYNKYKETVASRRAAGESFKDSSIKTELPKYTNPADLYKAIINSGNDGAQKLKAAGYPEEAKKLLADSITRAKAVCSDNCGY